MLSLKKLSVWAHKAMMLTAAGLVVSACGGSSGGANGTAVPTSTSNDPDTTAAVDSTVPYSGPAPRDATVQNFRSTLWQAVAQTNRCGACHVQGGAATPAFARSDNINTAYDTVAALIDSATPADSRLVTKLLEGHNCWLSNDRVCANLMTTWIQNFLGAGTSTSFLSALNLSDPTLRSVGQSKQFPASADEGSAVDFESTVYPLLNQYCAACHAADTATQQQPYLGGATADAMLGDPAAVAEDVNVAYEAARTRMNLETPSLSRLVTRLRDEGHNCWGGDCVQSADLMAAAIATFADNITPTTVDPDLVVSRALTLDDGLAASTGGGRAETDLIAKWDFGFGAGATAFDISGVDPAIDLNFVGDIEWLAAGGVRINDGKLQATTGASAKLYDRITRTGEFSIEAWVVPLNVTQDGPARIVTYSGAADRRNFTLGQTLYDYDFLTRSTTTDSDGQPALSTPMADEVLQASLQHVVVTYSATQGRSIYVNGALVSDADPEGAGAFSGWDRGFVLAVGDEVSNDNQWQGSVRFLAIYNRAMPAGDVLTNYTIGVGQKFYLLFSIADHISVPRSYIVMQVEQFDDYAYLFNEPFFVSLEPGVTLSDVAIAGMRIGVNGQQAAVGQAYANLNTTITQAAVTAGEGRQLLADVGTIIAVDQGATIDEFFLSFERLGAQTNVYVEATPTAQIPVASTDEQSDIGIKTFAEINEALSALTGISKTNSNVVATFNSVEQQLPVSEAIDGFVAAHQLAITQLAVSYCNELVSAEAQKDADAANDDGGYFPGVDFDNAVAAAFDSAGRDRIIAPLLDRLLANTVSLDDQPTFLDAQAELDSLTSTLISNCDNDNSCTQDSTRVRSMVTAICASAFGSGMMLIQ
ncbi:MAG: LamG domain-containing protein [Cellvibrionaceae bacterium]|nr:LamG domain-containing protein [Cellvibrionaceae bacterium]